MTTERPNIFASLLKEQYANLPLVIQAFHNTPKVIWQGQAKAGGATHLLAKTLRTIMGFPEPAEQLTVNIQVTFNDKGEERWTRQFGNKQFSSSLALDPKQPNQMYEKFGLVYQYFTLELIDNWLYWRLQYCTLFGIKIPALLQPKVIANEGVTADGSYQFVAKVTLPIIGTLVEYSGTLHSN